MDKRIAVLITGASGVAYGYKFLEEASKISGVETHLVISNSGAAVLKQELGISPKEVASLASFSYNENNFMAPIASGSFRMDGALVAPCSMKTLSGIANGYEDNLIIRAASIALKERWKLVLMPRETPLSVVHIKNMLAVAEAGGIIMPPLPQFYFETKNIDRIIELTAGRLLTMFGISNQLGREWEGFNPRAIEENNKGESGT
jgi:polyprenyl P-hydroxybenzoate/phenylacrylic acid decarboxylase-like protein